jgi:purine-binding chemotaxis protein CheW
LAKRQLVVFRIGSEEFAADIMLTKEVVLMREITPVPGTESYVEGVMNLRGTLVPVLDLRKRLRAGRTEASPEHRIIIVQLEAKPVGLIVDGASEVIRLSDDLIEPVPDLISEMGAEYIEGIINLKGRYITLINLQTALSGQILSDLDGIMTLLSGQREQLMPAHAV